MYSIDDMVNEIATAYNIEAGVDTCMQAYKERIEELCRETNMNWIKEIAVTLNQRWCDIKEALNRLSVGMVTYIAPIEDDYFVATIKGKSYKCYVNNYEKWNILYSHLNSTEVVLRVEEKYNDDEIAVTLIA